MDDFDDFYKDEEAVEVENEQWKSTKWWINEKRNEILFSVRIEIRLDEILDDLYDENDERINEIDSILKEISNEGQF